MCLCLRYDWQADQVDSAEGRTAYMWIVPAKVSGTWKIDVTGASARSYEATFSQQYQNVSGNAKADSKTVQLSNGKLRGETVTFNLDGRDFSGRVSGNKIEGTVKGAAATRSSPRPALPANTHLGPLRRGISRCVSSGMDEARNSATALDAAPADLQGSACPWAQCQRHEERGRLRLAPRRAGGVGRPSYRQRARGNIRLRSCNSSHRPVCAFVRTLPDAAR